jgi:mono/diheme cytochrome c family protein
MLQLVFSLFLAASLAAAQTKGASSSSGNAENGKTLWVKDGCYSCHGFDGHGGAGPKLAPRPMAVASFIAIVRHPPASGMPTFAAKVISDADLTDMWAYLRSIPDPPAVKDVPLLNP